jgi:hypothetical protein
MVGLLGAKIWVQNGVDFGNPLNLVPLAAGIIAGIGNLAIKFSDTFSITGIAAGTLIVLIGYHLVHILGPRVGVTPEPADAPIDPTHARSEARTESTAPEGNAVPDRRGTVPDR